jgi:hypothetical protein
MPKPKPTQVIRHEIVFGRKESAMLDSAMSAYTFNKIATPAVNLMNDVTGMYVFVNLIELFTKYDVPFIPTAPEGAEFIQEIMQEMAAYQQQNANVPQGEDRSPPENIGGVLYNLRNPNWNFTDFSWDALTGGIFQ